MCVLQIINKFFDKIIRIVHFWGGDIIKFSGDALTVVWPVDDEEDEDRREDTIVDGGCVFVVGQMGRV